MQWFVPVCKWTMSISKVESSDVIGTSTLWILIVMPLRNTFGNSNLCRHTNNNMVTASQKWKQPKDLHSIMANAGGSDNNTLMLRAVFRIFFLGTLTFLQFFVITVILVTFDVLINRIDSRIWIRNFDATKPINPWIQWIVQSHIKHWCRLWI